MEDLIAVAKPRASIDWTNASSGPDALAGFVPTVYALRALAYYLFNFSKKGAAKGRTLREQAAELLQVRMWGIGAKTPNRNALGPGDRVLIYVGAPEYEFIGHSELATPTHEWSPTEAAIYPGSFESGIAFTQAEVWQHPVPMKSVLPQLALRSRTRVRTSSQA